MWRRPSDGCTSDGRCPGSSQSDIDGIVALYGANTTEMADAGTGITPPDTATPDGTGDTGTTPDTPTADADNGGAGGCGGTQMAAGDGATGTGANAGMGDGGAPFAFGDLGGRFADLASLLNSMQGDNSDAVAGSPGAGLDGAQFAGLSNFVHKHFDNHLWG